MPVGAPSRCAACRTTRWRDTSPGSWSRRCGLACHPAARQEAGRLVAYLRDTQKADVTHVRTVTLKSAAECLVIDPITLRHLEVVTGSEGGVQGSLLHEIDRTVTSMAGRL